MSTQDEKRFYTPAPYTREVDEKGKPIPGQVRKVYHPRRGMNPAKVLDPKGEFVSVRPTETHHWARLERSGDVIRGAKATEATAIQAEAAKAEADAKKSKKGEG